jgi:hypothetical protein
MPAHIKIWKEAYDSLTDPQRIQRFHTFKIEEKIWDDGSHKPKGIEEPLRNRRLSPNHEMVKRSESIQLVQTKLRPLHDTATKQCHGGRMNK